MHFYRLGNQLLLLGVCYFNIKVILVGHTHTKFDLRMSRQLISYKTSDKFLQSYTVLTVHKYESA